jgi:SAM-dependent methyltransferase
VAEICDYEGSRYRTDFWEGQGRGYEDRVERLALERLLPLQGRRLVEIGAGYGRLADLYQGYDEVLLLDYARSQLEQARERLGDGRFRYIVADLYHMPLTDSCLDTATMIRVMHHVQDPAAALSEIARILAPQGVFILEYANKRNAKAMLRYLFRRQTWSPYSLEPVEFVRLNFDFHPAYMEGELQQLGFSLEERLAVSTFRLPLLKRALPDSLLVHLDGILQRPSARLRLAPSLFLRARALKVPSADVAEALFRCPACATAPLMSADEALACGGCGRRWPIQDGIYNFKDPIAA